MARPDTLPAWEQLRQLAGRPAPRVADCFASGPDRAVRLSGEAAGLFVDYSKHPVTDEILTALLELAGQAGVAGWRERLFSGEHVNNTEDRPALHMALRQDPRSVFPSAEFNVMPDVASGLRQMREICAAVSSGDWQGFSGKPIRDVVNIGIGGSDLGPRMLVQALATYRDSGPALHFVSNGDGGELNEVLQRLDPETTLFLVVSKTFTTSETLANAGRARAWLAAVAGEHPLDSHFIAISARVDTARQFGVAAVLPFQDWVGGRYSVWSTVGMAVALAVGMDAFEELLAGARDMDAHFRSAEPARNLPVMLALLGIWQTNFLGVSQHIVLPYSHYLGLLPAYLQQLEMESNGKGVDRDGRPVSYATGPALWGGVGSDAQHAFMQRLHQGPQDVPVDFILPLRVGHPYSEMHDALVANCLGQAEAFMRGLDADDLGAGGADPVGHRLLPGNRPCSTILLEDLSPRSLGALLALYEHKVFVQSVIWHINPFDQWGVEHGKRLAGQLLKEIESGRPGSHDASTLALIERYLRKRNS